MAVPIHQLVCISFCNRFLMNISINIRILLYSSVETVALLCQNFTHKQNRIHWLFLCNRLKDNCLLREKAFHLEEELTTKAAVNQDKFIALYGEFLYQAKSWDYSRRVICKIEKRPEELFVRHTFIVTNMELSP